MRNKLLTLIFILILTSSLIAEVLLRRDTQSNWNSVNPVPKLGEPCFETDTGLLKIGNGASNYLDLYYIGQLMPEVVIDSLEAEYGYIEVLDIDSTSISKAVIDTLTSNKITTTSIMSPSLDLKLNKSKVRDSILVALTAENVSKLGSEITDSELNNDITINTTNTIRQSGLWTGSGVHTLYQSGVYGDARARSFSQQVYNNGSNDVSFWQLYGGQLSSTYTHSSPKFECLSAYRSFAIGQVQNYYFHFVTFQPISDWNPTAPTYILSLTGNGRVGINDPTPSYPLDVNGTIRGTAIIGGTHTLSAKLNTADLGTAILTINNEKIQTDLLQLDSGDTATVSTPVEGMIIWQGNADKPYAYDGTNWKPLW